MKNRVCLSLLVLLASASGILHAQAHVERNVIYGMYSGLALLMDVHYPEESNGYGVILISGSGWNQPLNFDAVPLKNRDQDYKEWMASDELVSSGYTLFSVNHRAAPAFRYPAAIEDVQRAVRFVRFHAADYGIDPQMLGAIGHSSGAHLASMLGVLDGDERSDDPSPINQESAKVQAVVALATPTDLEALAESESNGITYLGSFIGHPYPHRQMPDPIAESLYREASPTTHISADDPPILLVHGTRDGVLPYSQSELFHSKLTEQGIPTELILISEGGHVMRKPESDGPSTAEYYPQVLSWFNEHLRSR